MKNSSDLWFDIEELSHFLKATFAIFFSRKWNDREKIQQKIYVQCAMRVAFHIFVCV